jgi:hypothetical protein
MRSQRLRGQLKSEKQSAINNLNNSVIIEIKIYYYNCKGNAEA